MMMPEGPSWLTQPTQPTAAAADAAAPHPPGGDFYASPSTAAAPNRRASTHSTSTDRLDAELDEAIAVALKAEDEAVGLRRALAVSYTHLTLPTILLV